LGDRRLAWRLDQLRGLSELELFVRGDAAPTDLPTVDRLPTLMDAVVFGSDEEIIGQVADAAVDLSSGRILHYLVSRSDPRLPGTSRWRLQPDRIVDQQPGRVITAVQSLDDLPLAKASVRQQFLRRSRRWRDQFQQVGDRFEERLEGWLEEPPWDEPEPRRNAQDAEAWDHWEAAETRVDPRDHQRRREEEDPWI
jgi:sporulation protein YlmC with PRC-barrel domain